MDIAGRPNYCPMQKVEILLSCNKDGLPLRSLALRGQFGGQDARQ
jgi:hypothetical protein